MPELPSRQVLDAIPGRVLTFLIGIGKSIVARTALQEAGYGQEEHDYAWSRLQRLGMLGAIATPTKDVAVASAVRELDAWDDDNFPSVLATLNRDFAEQAEFVFENLEVKQGAESVVAVGTLLDRLDALESGDGRPKASHKRDLAALELLAKRGYGKKVRAHLAELVATAKTVAAIEPITDDERTTILFELYGWFTDWSAQAKRLLKKKQQRIALGLASRTRKAKAKGDDAPAPVDGAPAPAPAPSPAPSNGHG
jgi:hypothetical protein